MDLPSTVDAGLHPIKHCNVILRSPLAYPLTSGPFLFYCVYEKVVRTKSLPRVLFSESLVVYVFVHKDWNFLS